MFLCNVLQGIINNWSCYEIYINLISVLGSISFARGDSSLASSRFGCYSFACCWHPSFVKSNYVLFFVYFPSLNFSFLLFLHFCILCCHRPRLDRNFVDPSPRVLKNCRPVRVD